MTEPSGAIPRTRWEEAGPSEVLRYTRTFERLVERGEDIEGEARLVDAVAPRGARILDAGSGTGRVAAALAARGHDVTAVEKDPDLVARHHARHPDVPVVAGDLLALTPHVLADAGRPSSYDVVVAVGNVLVYLAEDTEVRALRALAGLLVPGGRMVVGFHPVHGPRGARDYPRAEFAADAEAAGLVVEHLLGGYDLAPPADDYVVGLLRRPAGSA